MSFNTRVGKTSRVGITVFLMVCIFIGAVLAATFLITSNQPVTVTAPPFTVSVSSSASGVSCTGTTTITCGVVSLPVGGTETLTATITFGSQTSVGFTSLSANTAVATITPASGTIASPTTSQAFTVTGVATGSTSVSMTFQ